MTVLDASALLAYVRDEAGADAVEEALATEAVIGTVNLAEVLSKLADIGHDPDEAAAGIAMLPLEVAPFDEEAAVETARLRSLTAQAELPLGDRACLALGRIRGLSVLTADGAGAGYCRTSRSGSSASPTPARRGRRASSARSGRPRGRCPARIDACPPR